jgi:hypothetical protein
MAISTEIPIQTLLADTRKQVSWTWNGVLKMSGNSVVVAVAAVLVVILVVASVTLPKSMPDPAVSAEFGSAPD